MRAALVAAAGIGRAGVAACGGYAADGRMQHERGAGGVSVGVARDDGRGGGSHCGAGHSAAAEISNGRMDCGRICMCSMCRRRRRCHLIRDAKAEGLHVTCEVAPHHFTLTDEAIGEYDTNAKMNPPLARRG